MNWNEIFKSKGKTDLNKLAAIFQALKLDFDGVKFISVVGTNGKGSVANFMAQGLIEAKLNVGLFTSPHIEVLNERIKFNNQMIEDVEVEKILNDYPVLTDLHFFEKMLLIALIYFSKHNIDVIILEAGIGGKNDSTNIINAHIGVVTSIGKDHEHILGYTLESIAQDKAGIINEGMQFFIPNNMTQELQTIFIEKVNNTPKSNYVLVESTSFSYSLSNKMLAQSILQKAFDLECDLASFIDLPARSEVVNHGDYHYIYDVAHNYDGMKASKSELNYRNIEFGIVVICLSRSKEMTNIKSLWNDKKVYTFQLDDSFYSSKELNAIPIENIEEFNPHENTLFIGSFYFMGALWKTK